MGEKFDVEPGALTATGKVFTDMVDDINTVSTTAQTLDFDSGTAGTGYAAQGTAYHAAMQKLVSTLLSPMSAKATWVGVTLDSTASRYAKQDTDNSASLTTSGEGA